MAISFNNSANPTAVTFNGNTVNEVIFNGITVWTAGLIPGIYQQLEFIESSGTQWIDTGVNGGTTPEFEIKFNDLGKQPQNYYMYFGGTGTYQGTQTPKLYLYAHSGDSQGRYGYVIDDANIKLFYTIFDTNTVELKNGNYYVNGSLVGSYNFNQGWSYTGYNVWIFNNARETNLAAPMRLFYCKMWTDGVLVRDYVPVKIKATGEVGLYDLVTRQFYGNNGTGLFIAGPSILPDTYSLLEYIEATGTQYIDTGVSGGSSCKYNYIFTPKVNNVNTYQHFLGGTDSAPTSNMTFPKIYQRNNTLSTTNGDIRIQTYASGSSALISYSGTTYMGTLLKVSYSIEESNKITFNGATNSTTLTNSGWGTAYTVKIFTDGEADSTRCACGRIYHLEMYTDNALARYYIPVKRNSDDEIGLFDLVTQTFYINQGTGAFVAGPEKYDDNYWLLGYIESTNASSTSTGPHIVLDVYGDEVDKFDIKARWYTIPTDRGAGAMLYEELNTSPWNGLGVRVKRTNGALTLNYGTSEITPITGTSSTINTDLEIKGFGNVSTYTVNGTTYTHTPASSPAHYLITLFCENYSGDYIYHTNGRLYYAKLYDANGSVIRDLVPVKRISDGAIGMYDIVNKQFYANSGSGTFSYGTN